MALTPTPFVTTPAPAPDTRAPGETDLPHHDRPRWRRFRPGWVAVGVLALTSAILVIGAPGPWQRTHAAVQGVGVGGAADVFTPAALTVTAGDSVTWTWAGGKHSVTAGGAEPFDSGSLSAGTFSHTFATPGTFSYLCVWHSGMTGSITVVAAAPAPAAAPAASTPGAVAAAPQTAQAGRVVTRAGRPRLAGVRVSGSKLRFRLNESATVVVLAFRPHAARGIRIGRVGASAGAGAVDLRLDRLHPSRYRLVVRATDTSGKHSKATRIGYLLTHRVWQRAVAARRALAETPPAAAPVVPSASPPVTPPAVAPAVPGAGAPVPPSSDDDGDSGSNSSGSNSSGSNGSGSGGS